MATPVIRRSEYPQPHQRHIAFDSVLKYAAFLSAFAFAAGYQIKVNYYLLLKIPWRAEGSDTPDLLYTGSYCILCGVFGGFSSLVFTPESPLIILRRNVTRTACWITPGVITLLFTARLWSAPYPGYNVVRCVAAYLIAVYLFAWAFNNPTDDDDRHGIFSLGVCLLALYVLLWGASYEGVISAQSTINANPNTRLLLAPDASELGLRGLRLTPGNQCLVSEPTTVAAITDDAYYVILPNRTTMSIRKDKVIGTLIVRKY